MKTVFISCIDGRTALASVGLGGVPGIVNLRLRGGVASPKMVAEHVVGARTSTIVATWHRSASQQGGGCAAHLGDDVSAADATYALARKLRHLLPHVPVICACIDTDVGRIEFDARQLRVINAYAAQAVEELQQLNNEHVAWVEAGGEHVISHAEEHVVYGKQADLDRMALAHGKALAVTALEAQEDARALGTALSVLKELNRQPTIRVVAPLNGSKNTTRAHCVDLLHAVHPYLGLDEITFECIGITVEGRPVRID